MRLPRHMPPVEEWKLPKWGQTGIEQFTQGRFKRWSIWGTLALLAGYLTAYLVIFPAPMLHGHQLVPRVLGESVTEATQQIRKAGFDTRDGGAETHPTAGAGTVIWQDPPPGVSAPSGAKITLVASSGPPKIPVPDVSGLDGGLSQKLVTAAGLTVAAVESVQAAAPAGIVMLTRPPAAALLAPGGGVTIVVSRGAPTISVPDLLGLTIADARTRLETDGLQLGNVTRRRTTDANPGTVVAQRPAAGTLAAAGTVIDIVVARSPQ